MPHICFTWELQTKERSSIHSQVCYLSAPTAKTIKTLMMGCYQLSISYFTPVWGSACPREGEIIRLKTSYIMLMSTTCFVLPSLKFIHFSLFIKFVFACHCVVPPGLAISQDRFRPWEPIEWDPKLCKTRRCSYCRSDLIRLKKRPRPGLWDVKQRFRQITIIKNATAFSLQQ